MSLIKNVAVVGASGNLGKPVVEQLSAAGFNVTALTRESSKVTFPSGVQVKKVDYDSVESLKSALKGQDAVVCTTATMASGVQKPIVDAAVAVGVKRFIPSEFGLNTRTVTHPVLKNMLQTKVLTIDHLIEQNKKNPSFTWTGVSTGMFFDWGLKEFGLGFDKAAKKATVIDSGNKFIYSTNLPFIGKALAAILTKSEETANQYLCVASFIHTPRELVKIVEEESGEKWEVESVKSSDLNTQGNEKLKNGDPMAFLNFLLEYVHGDGYDYSAKTEKFANDLLGIGFEDPRPTVKAFLDGKL